MFYTTKLCFDHPLSTAQLDRHWNSEILRYRRFYESDDVVQSERASMTVTMVTLYDLMMYDKTWIHAVRCMVVTVVSDSTCITYDVRCIPLRIYDHVLYESWCTMTDDDVWMRECEPCEYMTYACMVPGWCMVML